MPRPGEYLPDQTEGVKRIEDLPRPKVIERRRDYKHRPCPHCGHSAYRDKRMERVLHDLGDPRTGQPVDLHVTYSQHYCSRCRRYFNADMSDWASPGSSYTQRVVSAGVRAVVEDGLPYRAVSWRLWRDQRVFVPFATLQNWCEASGEKRRPAHGNRVSRRGAGGLFRIHRGR